MTPQALWNRYANTWSAPADVRTEELLSCLTDEVTYCDPNGLIQGRSALSEYMAAFQRQFPGGLFTIREVLFHNGRTLAHWTLCAPDGRSIQSGTSFGLLAIDGRFTSITGFFYSAEPEVTS
jgi:SnoaL-like domain